MRVLFVDDDDVTLFLYRQLVKAFPDCEAFFAKDGSEALSFINQSPEAIDFMFMDINMPVMDGHALLENHSHLPELKQVRNIYVMLGTDIAPDKKEKLYSYPSVQDCVPKPLRGEIFNEIVAQKLK